MKPVSPKILLVIISSAVVLTGCTKKPMRPDPSATMLGPQGGGASTLTPEAVSAGPDVNALQAREAGFDASGQLRGQVEAVYFDFDKSNVKQVERPKIQAAKAYMDKNAQYRMLLEGHCDWRGTAEYNLALGDRRANEVKKYLLTLGVSPDKLDTLSKGSEEAKRNADEATMAKDRRVEFVVVKAAGQ
jgi:peptidoglycan-associated lipoprotein